MSISYDDNHYIITPVTLLRSLSGKYPWETYKPPNPPSYGLLYHYCSRRVALVDMPLNKETNQTKPSFAHTSSCRSISTSIPDLLSPPLPIVHRIQHVYTELLYVGSSWSPCFCTAMWSDPQEYITHELVPISPVVSRMPVSSNFNSFRDG